MTMDAIHLELLKTMYKRSRFAELNSVLIYRKIRGIKVFRNPRVHLTASDRKEQVRRKCVASVSPDTHMLDT